MPEHLKPCPFYHEQSRIRIRKRRSRIGAPFRYFCKCGLCGCSGPVKSNEIEAIRAWNERDKASEESTFKKEDRVFSDAEWKRRAEIAEAINAQNTAYIADLVSVIDILRSTRENNNSFPVDDLDDNRRSILMGDSELCSTGETGSISAAV